jgi:hypothetical protein
VPPAAVAVPETDRHFSRKANTDYTKIIDKIRSDQIRVPRFIGACHHGQFTVPLCLGVRGPGIAELRSVASRESCSVVTPNNLILSILDRQITLGI